MKQGIKFKLPIQIGINLDKVEQIEFIFKQGKTTKEFIYPSEVAIRRPNDNIVDLSWDSEDTYMFKPTYMDMDTRIYLKDTDEQPETQIVNLKLNPTLFEKEHSHD